MRLAIVFIAVAACSGGNTQGPPKKLAVPEPHAEPALDAAAAAEPPHAPPGVVGAACTPSPPPSGTCAQQTMCMPFFPGGYCTAPCGVVGFPCGGACVETSKAGELCMASCSSDADCRAKDGYICDPQWHACTMPNFVAIVPKQCAAAKGEPARDTAFGESEPWSSTSSPGVYQFEPAGALTDDGGLVAIYLSRGAIFEGNKLGVARVSGKGEKTLDAPLAVADRQSQFDPWLARGKDGTLYAVWYAFDGRDARPEIVLATSKDRGATWSEPRAVHEPKDCEGEEGDTGCLDKPMVAVGPDPKTKTAEIVYVAYSAHESGLRVRASRDGGKTFGTASTATEGIYANIEVGADGRVHVASLNGGPNGALGSAQNHVDYAVSGDAGATWTRTVVSPRDETIPFFFVNPSVAVDTARKWTYVAYARGGRDAVWDIVIAATKDNGKTWTRTSISDGCAIHMIPNVALDSTTGTLHVAWYDSEGAIGRFAHATCTPGAAKCTRRGAINSVPFAALSTERHGAKWIGEYEVLLVDAKRRTLHAAWSQPVAEDGKIVARIFHASAKLR